MAKGQDFNGEIIHFHAVRLRVTGVGNLDMEFKSLDDVNITLIPSVSMLTATNKEPTVLSNVREQRAQLRVSVNAIDEYFNISKITIFIRPIATGYPQ